MKTAGYGGNTLTEYGIIGAVILMAMIFFLVLFGRNLDAALKGMKGEMQGTVASAKAYRKKVAAEKALGGKTAGPTITVCTKTIGNSNACAEIPYSAKQVIIQVAGSIGNEMTPETFAALLGAAAPYMTPEENERIVNKLIIDLANAGHEIAASQKELSFVCDSTGACDVNFNMSNSEFNKLTNKEKAKIQKKLDELNQIKSMLDNALAAMPAALPEVNQSEINNDTAQTNSNVANQNSGNIGNISRNTRNHSNNTCNQQHNGDSRNCTR